MVIRIGREVFEVLYVDDPIRDGNDQCAAEIVEESRQIRISSRVPPHLRAQALAIAVNEAWCRRGAPLVKIDRP